MTQLLKTPGYFFISIFAVLLIVSCGTTDEVRTVDDGPRTSTERAPEDAEPEERFMEISIGMIDPVDNLDPLFANNLSTMRLLSLIYDGLYTIDNNGEVAHAIAAEHTASDDGLTYRFTLRNNLFFHDSSVFQAGVGRRLQAADVKWAFERTSRLSVPTRASELLMNIEGYEEYFEDQRKVYDPERRALQGVSGIRVIDSRTIEFRLLEPDEDFLEKLASPYLFIYPREAIQREGLSLKRNPVGTGAYTFQERTDNRVVLARDNSDRLEDRLTNPRINRIEFVHHSREGQLFQDFARGNIHWLPEVGPETKRVGITSDGELTQGYRQEYTLTSSGARHIHYYLNETRRVNMNWLRNRLSEFEPDSIDVRNNIIVHRAVSPSDSDTIGEPDSFYLATFTNDLFIRTTLSRIQEQYLEPDSEIRLSDIRTPVSRTAIFTRLSDSFHEPLTDTLRTPWFTHYSTVNGLYHNEIEGIGSHTVPWKLFIENVRLDLSNEDSQ